MCYNCGCGMLNNNMGNKDNITEEDFQKASEATGQSEEDTKRHVYESLKKDLNLGE